MRPLISSPPLSFGATAEYNRSGQPKSPLLLLGSAIDRSALFLRGASRKSRNRDHSQAAIAHPALGKVCSLLKGAPTVALGFQSSVPNRIRCRIAEPVSFASPSQVAETSRERVTLPSRFRVTNVFAPLRRQRASTTADACLLSDRTRAAICQVDASGTLLDESKTVDPKLASRLFPPAG